MSFKRLIARLVFHGIKQLIILVSYFNHRLHTQMLTGLLRLYGMKFSGSPRYIGSHVRFDDIKNIKLSERVVISDYCELLTHDYSLTTAKIAINEKPHSDMALLGSISIGKNVFIGTKSIIMPNTIIGDNVIVGAGSVVRGKLESNSIYIGNPAIRIKNIEEMAHKWSKRTDLKVD